jgi:hypothetical protein
MSPWRDKQKDQVSIEVLKQIIAKTNQARNHYLTYRTVLTSQQEEEAREWSEEMDRRVEEAEAKKRSHT